MRYLQKISVLICRFYVNLFIMRFFLVKYDNSAQSILYQKA